MSCVIGPPESCIVFGSWRVRSPLIAVPGLSAVGRLPHVLRRGVEHVRIDGREDDRERPLPALLHRARRLAREEARIRAHLAQLAGAAIEPREERCRCSRRRRRCRSSSGRARCSRARRRPAVVAAARRCRGRHRRRPPPRLVAARHAQRAVVLLRAADVIRHVLGRDHVIELRRSENPGRPGALRDVARCSVTAPPPSLPSTTCFGVVRIDPEVVVIAVRAVADVLRASCRRRPSGTRSCSARRRCPCCSGSAKTCV